MKFEIAKELGLADKVIAGGWRCLTAKESGRIGGLVTKKKREMSAENARIRRIQRKTAIETMVVFFYN